MSAAPPPQSVPLFSVGQWHSEFLAGVIVEDDTDDKDPDATPTKGKPKGGKKGKAEKAA